MYLLFYFFLLLYIGISNNRYKTGMHILFVSSGNSKSGISPITKNQGESLVSIGHQVSYFTIQGKGLKGYISNVFILRKYLKNNFFDIIHAHYSLSAFVASLAGAKPLVVSLMGSDVKASSFIKYLIRLYSFFFWETIIVKSKDMKNSSNLTKAHIIPNGVNLDRFKPIEKEASIKITKWNIDKKQILFAANPGRKEKNFQLANEAFKLLSDKNIELQTLINIPNELIPYYLNNADVVLLPSLWEGSPNIIKEAMACNKPLVTTDVGDVKELIENVSGCFIASFDPEDVALKIKLALQFIEEKGRTEGRIHIAKLGLDSKDIAKRITEVYKKILYINDAKK